MSKENGTIDISGGTSTYVMGEKEFQENITKWEPLPTQESYYPTRLEYFAGKALQGLVTGRSIKDLAAAAKQALQLAEEMEQAIDKAQD